MMEDVISLYKKAFAEHGDSVKSVFWPKGRQDERFSALTRYMAHQEATVLDFGCGLGHLKTFIESNFKKKTVYHGMDVVEEFISNDKRKFSDQEFTLIHSYQDVDKEYDFIFLSGVFNILYVADENDHQQIVFDTLTHLFSKTRKMLAANFMTDQVDFKQPGAFHQNIERLYQFTKDKLSRRMVIDQSYMPYEYTISIFKDQEILRPENIYST